MVFSRWSAKLFSLCLKSLLHTIFNQLKVWEGSKKIERCMIVRQNVKIDLWWAAVLPTFRTTGLRNLFVISCCLSPETKISDLLSAPESLVTWPKPERHWTCEMPTPIPDSTELLMSRYLLRLCYCSVCPYNYFKRKFRPFTKYQECRFLIRNLPLFH